MKTYRAVFGVLALSVVGITACSDEDFMIPDLNNPGLEELQDAPTRQAIIDATQGLMIGSRTGMTNQAGYVAQLGILGRESLTFDSSDPRFIDEMLGGDLDAGNGAFGGSGWTFRYRNLRTANIILNSLDKLVGVSDDELEGIRGFAKTIQALDLLLVANTRRENGMVIDVNRPLEDDPAPFVDFAAALTAISALLDEANGHLGSGGDAFAFQLTSGYAGFDTPATMRQFNRALKARVELYRGNHQAALTAIGSSFLGAGTAADFNVGVYHTFSTLAGDASNGLFQGSAPQIVAHPSIRDEAELKSDGSLDDRVASKTSIMETGLVDGRGVASDVRLDIYPAQGSPLSIIRGEELLLIRAEARWFTGNAAGAMADLNTIRTGSGGLDEVGMATSEGDFITELLKQRRLSLLVEGGHRWIDGTRFGRTAEFARDRPADFIPDAFPIPRPECIARGLSVPCGM